MRTVTIEVGAFDKAEQRMEAAFRGEYQGCFISFPSHERMMAVLTQKRWEIVKALLGQEAMSIREIARRVDRDVKAVHGDVHVLLNSGVLDRTESGKIEFPYEAVHVDFTIQASDQAA